MVNYYTSKSIGWDKSAQSSSVILSPTGGFSTNFAIDALDLTIPNDDINKEMIMLDFAAGCGPLSLYASTKYRNSKIIAIDFSSKMLEILENYINNNKIKENQLNNIEIKIMDGQCLNGIKDSSADYTFSIFGLIFFTDRIKGMKEMYRVLKSNGKTAIASWCKESFLPQVFQNTMNELLGDGSIYQQAALSLSDKNLFEDELKQSGFKDIQIKIVQHPMQVNEISDLVQLLSTNPAYIDCIEMLPNEKKHLFDETFKKHALKLHSLIRNSNGKLNLNSYSYIGIGTK